jgi:hypothetical protein
MLTDNRDTAACFFFLGNTDAWYAGKQLGQVSHREGRGGKAKYIQW